MLLLITGASGAGKSTARRLATPALGQAVEGLELIDVYLEPQPWTKIDRQRATEAVVRHAIALQASGRHTLLGGDPVAVGEVLAAPSARELNGFAALLLDLRPDVQAARLRERGDDLTDLVHHQRFAAWMRRHAEDPWHMPEVLTTDGWPPMRWDRWADWEAGDLRWDVTVLDASDRSPDQVANEVVTWARDRIAASH